jgi:ParB/RepB/Spo0J family partition protein
MPDLREILLTAIIPSPYQVRKAFPPVKLRELADSMARDGQVHPIVVRQVENRFEIIAGERRWRANQLMPGATTILAQVIEAPDLQARRMLVAENVLREDLAPLEWVEAVAEVVDAELIELTEYAALGATAIERVRTQLMKLQSDETHGISHVSPFTNDRMVRLFAQLPRRMTWQSYLTNDLPLLKLPEEVKQVAVAEKLNKSKIEALGELARRAPEKFERVVADTGLRPVRDFTDRHAQGNDVRPLSQVSARELRHVIDRHETERKHREGQENRAEQARTGPGRFEVRQQEMCIFVESVHQGSVDLLLTDPPYMTDLKQGETIEAFVQWVPLALSRLKPSGRAFIFTGAYPQEIWAYVKVFLQAQEQGWIVCPPLIWTYKNTLGPKPTYDFKQNHQLIWPLRGPDAPPLNSPMMTEQFSVIEVNAPDRRLGDRFHRWQKPLELAERLILCSTLEGARMIDPFAGTGTFLIAAAQYGRDALGCDHDPEIIEIARRRGVQTVSCGITASGACT